MSEKTLNYTPFDPNMDFESVKSVSNYGAVFPSVSSLGVGPVTSAKQYADIFTQAIEGTSSFETFVTEMAKAIRQAPSMEKFAKLELMPQQYSDSLMSPPGIPFEMLTKISDDNLFVKPIIQGRIADILRYSEKSSHPWKPGWAIELKSGFTAPTEAQKKQIIDAENFISNCAYGDISVRQRDKLGYRPFRNFLAAFVRDRLRYDFVTVYTDMDTRDQVQAFKVFPAACVRLASPKGYKNDPEIFAVGLDNGYNISQTFTRKQLFTVVQNERSDPDWGGYGYSEAEQVLRVLQGFTDCFTLLCDTFNKNAVPNGILMAEGMWGPRQLEILTAIWQNLKKGVSKGHALPVMAMPKDGGLEILDLTKMKDNAEYFAPFLNLSAGLIAATYNFPVDRLGFHVNGTTAADTRPESDTASGTIIDNADPGLAPLLSLIADSISAYIIDSRWPELKFVFRGANPKEDAREYEARMKASTWGEARALSDLMPVAKLGEDEDQSEVLKYMDLCPTDPIVASVYQNIITALIASKTTEKATAEKPQGALMQNKTDPAKAETHGHTSGVRRDSAGEKKKSLTPLYICRYVVNSDEILSWAETQGLMNLYAPEDLHVTVAYSKTPVDWDMMGSAPDSVTIPSGGYRALDYFGPSNTSLVLKFASASLTNRWHTLLENGASFEHESYSPHITLSNSSPNIDLTQIVPFKGKIILGEEVFSTLDDDRNNAEAIDERTRARFL